MAKLHEVFQSDKRSKRVVLQYVIPPRAKDVLVIDAAIRRSHVSKTTPTESPVEFGSKITDHVDVSPNEFHLEGVISNTPIELVDALVGNGAGVVGSFLSKKVADVPGSSSVPTGALFTGAVGVMGGALLNGLGGGRISKAYQSLLELQYNAIPVNVTERLRSYENMILTDLTVDRDASTADSLFFRATLREIRIVSNEIVKIPKEFLDSSVAHTATGSTNMGQQSPTEASPDPSVKGPKASFAYTAVFGDE